MIWWNNNKFSWKKKSYAELSRGVENNSRLRNFGWKHHLRNFFLEMAGLTGKTTIPYRRFLPRLIRSNGGRRGFGYSGRNCTAFWNPLPLAWPMTVVSQKCIREEGVKAIELKIVYIFVDTLKIIFKGCSRFFVILKNTRHCSFEILSFFPFSFIVLCSLVPFKAFDISNFIF